MGFTPQTQPLVVAPRGPLGSRWAAWRVTGLKWCPSCSTEKAIDDFSFGKNGRPMGHCTACYREKHKAYTRTEAGRAAARRYAKKRDPYKHWVRVFTNAAIQIGVLVRQPCDVCGLAKVDAHHEDYGKPLEVRWLCRAHHSALHQEAGPC